jgi:hypothetical protein
MTNAVDVCQQGFAPAQDEASREFARDLPPTVDWRSKARRVLAPDDLGIDGDDRIIRMCGTPTGFTLEPLISGRQVYIRDEGGTRYWLGSPNRLPAVLRWLLS